MGAFSVGKRLSQSLAARAGFRLERAYEFGDYRLDALGLVVDTVRAERGDNAFFFVQVGANDGVTGDPLHLLVRKHGWKGLLVEPQPDIFEQLRHNYADQEQLLFENAALAKTDGTMSLWTIGDRHGQSSFNAEVLLRAGYKRSDLVERTVDAVSVRTLLDKHAVSDIDLLQVDTEGFDYEVLKMFVEEAGITPRIINYEHLHLSAQDRSACTEMLGRRGYRMMQAGPERIDTVCLLQA